MILLSSADNTVQQRWQEGLSGFASCEVVADMQAMQHLLDTKSPELVLVDLELPGLTSTSGISDLVGKQNGSLFFVMATEPSDTEGLGYIKAGCRGYANRMMSPTLLKKAVEVVLNGEVWVGRKLMLRLIEELATHNQPVIVDNNKRLADLSKRELEIARMVSEGASNKVIAHDLDITERTVKAHITSIFRKANVSDRLQLALLVTGKNK